MNRVAWTRRWMPSGAVLLALTCAINACPPCARADEAAEKKGAALMNKYVEVTGGKAAYEAIKSRTLKGSRVMPGGQTVKFESYWVSPNKFRHIMDLPNGTLERGSDGKTVWIIFPAEVTIQGAQRSEVTIFEGAQRVAAIRDSSQEKFGCWSSIFQKAEYVDDEDVDGTKCSKVALTYKPIDPDVIEPPMTVFIAQDSGLIVKWTNEYTDKSAEGEASVVVTIRLSDYRKVGDVRVPHQMMVSFQDDELATKVEEIVFNADIPADKFALPERVKKELESQAAQSKAKK